MFGQGEKNDNKTQGKEAAEPKMHLLPPSDIVGKVAEEILRRANVSEEEANRELIRVEKVDETVDKEKEDSKRLNKQDRGLLKKVKESRGVGGKKSEKKLVRVERVDLTDEEEDEENEPAKPVHETGSHGRAKPNNTATEPEKPVHESGSHRRAKPNNTTIVSAEKRKGSSRMVSGMDSKTEDSESAHVKRLGRMKVLEDQSYNLTNRNTTMEVSRKSTLPPFFANFLNVTAKERQMIDLLHNFTNNSEPFDELKPSIFHQGNGTEKKKTKMAKYPDISSAYAQKADIREKRNHKEANLLDTLVSKLLNITGDRKSSLGQQNDSERFNEPFNLSGILDKITQRGQNLVNKDMQNSVSDSTALLVKFLKEGSRYRLRMPHNVTTAHTIKDNNRIAATKLGSHEPEGAINLKKTLLDLANHIDLTNHGNHSETITDQENKADLMMLKLLLHQSTLQDLSTFNLSRVLSEIAGNSLKSRLTALQPLKVKRDENEGNLGSTIAQAGVKIFRPVPDKLETRTTEPVLNTDRKPNISLKGDNVPSPSFDSLNTTSVGMGSRTNRASFSIGGGSGETRDEESRRFV